MSTGHLALARLRLIVSQFGLTINNVTACNPVEWALWTEHHMVFQGTPDRVSDFIVGLLACDTFRLKFEPLHRVDHHDKH